MANFINMLLEKFNLSEEYDDDEDDDYDDDDFEEEEEEERSPFRAKKTKPVKETSFEPRVEKRNNVLPYNRNKSKGSGMAVCVIKPVTMEDGREIADTLNTGRAVLLNLEDVDSELAQRIVDFAAGASYAIGGNLQKISTFIFVITPSTVEITGDFQEMVNNMATSSSGMNSMNMNGMGSMNTMGSMNGMGNMNGMNNGMGSMNNMNMNRYRF